MFPVVEMKIDAFVEGEKEIAVGDILTIKITVTQKNIKQGESAGFVHSNMYPYLKQACWYLVFTDPDEREVFAMEKIAVNDHIFVKEIKERMGQAGKLNISIHLRNDSYKGFDKHCKHEIAVLPTVKR